jgi:hypothetical protein
MLEILFIVWLTKKLAASAFAKGHSKAWGALGAIFWIGGEIGGFIVGAVLDLDRLAAYGLALLCAGAGAGMAAFLVSLLGDRSQEAAYGGGPGGRGPFDPSNPYSPPGG